MASPLPADARDRKRIPLVTGCLDYFPAALAEVAKVSLAGNEQHHPGEPLHHERGKSADHADALARHLEDRGTRDVDGQLHSAKVAWRALALLQEELEAAGAPLARGARLPEEASTPASEAAEPVPAPASVPCAECGERDGNGECSAQCVREEGSPATPARVPGRECATCRHDSTNSGNYDGACNDCRVWNHWEPRGCATCRHYLRWTSEPPCCDCRYCSRWEARP